MDDQKLFTSNVELTTELVGLPVDDSEAFVVWIEDGLQKLQFGLQPRNRHLPLISSRAAGEGGEVRTYYNHAVDKNQAQLAKKQRKTKQAFEKF